MIMQRPGSFLFSTFGSMVNFGASEMGLTVDIGPHYANLPGFYVTKVAALCFCQIVSSHRRVLRLLGRGKCNVL
jgi:hypothetical protein